MAQLSKQALIVENNSSFPNNTSNYITPAILRSFNTDMIDSLVDENTYNVDSASWNSNISQLNAFTASASGLTTSSLLITASASGPNITFTKGNGSQFTINAATDLSALNSFTQSAQISINNLNTATASLNTSVSNINTFTASTAISITNLNAATASFSTIVNGLVAKTGSYATTGSNTFVSANTFTSISASSFLSASAFVGDGSKLTNIPGAVPLTSLNAFTASAQISLNNLNAATSSYITSAVTSSMSVATASIALAVSTSISTQNLQHFITFVDNSTGKQNVYVDGGLKYNPNLDLVLTGNITASGYISASSLNLSSTLTASLQSGYVWVGNGNNISTLVATSSFLDAAPLTSLNAYTASQDTKNATLGNLTGSLSSSVNQLNAYTASNDTKWSNLQTTTASFSASVASISALTASFATTGSNSFVGNQIITGSLYVSSSTQYDVIVEGQVFITGSTTASGSTTQPRFTLAGALAGTAFGSRSGSVAITPNSVVVTRGTNRVQLSQFGIYAAGSAVSIGTQASDYSQIGIDVTDNSTFYTAFNAFNDETGTSFRDYDNTTTNYSVWLTLGPNDGVTIPIPQFTRGLSVSGSGGLQVTGSAHGNVVSMSITSNTASMDLNSGNYFTLSIPTGTTRINTSNIQAGTTATLVITTASGSLVTFDSAVKQPSGSAYVPTSGSVDVLSFVSVNTNNLYVVSTLNMV